MIKLKCFDMATIDELKCFNMETIDPKTSNKNVQRKWRSKEFTDPKIANGIKGVYYHKYSHILPCLLNSISNFHLVARARWKKKCNETLETFGWKIKSKITEE